MPRAIWNDAMIAESAQYESVDGNVYFPPEALSRDHLRPSTHTSICSWKGVAHYYDIVVGGEVKRRRLVLPRSEPGSGKDQGPCRILEGRESRSVNCRAGEAQRRADQPGCVRRFDEGAG